MYQQPPSLVSATSSGSRRRSSHQIVFNETTNDADEEWTSSVMQHVVSERSAGGDGTSAAFAADEEIKRRESNARANSYSSAFGVQPLPLASGSVPRAPLIESSDDEEDGRPAQASRGNQSEEDDLMKLVASRSQAFVNGQAATISVDRAGVSPTSTKRSLTFFQGGLPGAHSVPGIAPLRDRTGSVRSSTASNKNINNKDSAEEKTTTKKNPEAQQPTESGTIGTGSGSGVTLLGSDTDEEMGQHEIIDADCRPKSEEYTTTNEKDVNRKRWYLVLAGFVLVLLAIAIPVALLLPKGEQTPAEPEEIPRANIHGVERGSYLVPYLPNITIEAIAMDGTQQQHAYEWISQDPNWDTYEDWRKQQRFAMMTLYFGFGEDDGVQQTYDPSYDTHECEWMLGSVACLGNDEGEVRVMGLHDLEETRFQGSLPPELSFLPQLEEIRFHGVAMTKSLDQVLPPDTLHSLPPIKTLSFRDCDLEGSIPTTFGLLANLTSLEIRNANLASSIPSELGVLAGLSSLVLSSNQLTGGIPAEVGDLPLLTVFDVRGNPTLDESMPKGFCTADHIFFESLQTDWCSNPFRCCQV